MKRIVTTIPGSLMLLGEHAVLYGSKAMAMSINKRLQVTVIPQSSPEIHLKSAIHDRNFSLQDPQLTAQLTGDFVLNTIHHFIPQISNNGLSIEIHTDIPMDKGYGSSAAVVGALCAALYGFTTHTVRFTKENLKEVHQIGLGVIRKTQGKGSGTDLAASLKGGVVIYHEPTQSLNQIVKKLAVIAVYSGDKEKTPSVIKTVQQKIKTYPEIFHSIFKSVNQSIKLARKSLVQGNLDQLGEILSLNQKIMEMYGVCNKELQEIIGSLEIHSEIKGAKISGSGLGDCVIGIADKKPNIILNYPWEWLEADQGLTYEAK